MSRNESRTARELDQALTALQLGTGLAAHAVTRDAELSTLLETARWVRSSLPPAAPSARLLAAPSGRFWQRSRPIPLNRRPLPARGRGVWGGVRRLGFALVAVALVLAATTAGAAYAARDTIPGETLYTVKRAVESVRLELAHSPESQAKLLADLADERLREADRLAALGRAEALEAALLEYQADVDQASDLAADLPQDRRQAVLAELQLHLQQHLETLERVRTQVPPAAVPAIDRAIERSGHSEDVIKGLQGGQNPSEIAPGLLKTPGPPEAHPTPRAKPPKSKKP